MRRRAISSLLLLATLGLGSSGVVAQSADPVLPATIEAPTGTERDPLAAVRHKDLEALYGEGKAAEGLRLTRARLKAAPDDVELYVHAARFLFDEGEAVAESASKREKEARYKEMLELVDAGLKLAPGHPRLLWGRGLALARLATTRGVLGSLGKAKEVVTAWEAVLESGYRYESAGAREIIPCDTYLTLSIMYRLVPDLWMMGAVSGVRGDLDKSLRFAERSNRCRPGRIRAEKELGVIQLCLGAERKKPELVERGKATLQMALNRKPRTDLERLDLKHAEMLLNDPNLACGYSRAGQQKRK